MIFFVGAITAASGHVTFHPELWHKEARGSKVIYHCIGVLQPDGH